MIAGGATVCWAGLFVCLYNRVLSRLHESFLKKGFSLAMLPMGVAAGILTGVSAFQGEAPPTWEIAIASIGFFITAWYAWVARRRSLLEASSQFRELAGTGGMDQGINWPKYHPLVALLLRKSARFNEVCTLRLHAREVAVPGLPPEFDGYRICHLTDFHLHPTLSEEWFRAVRREAETLAPDLLLYGGDFISREKHIPLISHFLEGIHAPDGVWFVRGNHDFWRGPQRTVRLARRAGMQHLSNQGVRIERGKAAIGLIGLETPYIPLTREDGKALATLPPVRIGLVHTPDAYVIARKLGCVVALGGHTHGGQIRLPLFGTTLSNISLGPSHASGVSRLGNMTAITSNGQGAFFPIRYRCPPEIVLVTLRAAD